MNHATVKIGDFTIPLLGIPQKATEEVCDGCRVKKHITEIHFQGKQFYCADCASKKKRATKKLE